MTAERVIEVEFLQDDLREIRAVMTDSGQSGQSELSTLLTRGLESFQQDEASWTDVQDSDDSQPFREELKRRETLALLISMRSRTTRSEIRMNELGNRVRYLEDRHAEKRRESELLRRSISQLRKRTVRVEESLNQDALREDRPRSLMVRLMRFFRRGNG